MSHELRTAAERSLDLLEMYNFNRGFEACLNGIDEIANTWWNDGRQHRAEILRELIAELKGETDGQDK